MRYLRGKSVRGTYEGQTVVTFWYISSHLELEHVWVGQAHQVLRADFLAQLIFAHFSEVSVFKAVNFCKGKRWFN